MVAEVLSYPRPIDDLEIRPITEAELPDLQAITTYAFGGFGGQPAPWIHPDWTTCAFVGGRLASTFGAWPFRVRLNGRAVPMAGITMVATLPEFRRRGLLRTVMTKALADQRDRGQAIAILWASLGAIYQRYGFGLASLDVTYEVHPRHVAFADGERASGTVRRHTRDEARPIFEALYQEYSGPRNLLIQRSKAMWDIRQHGDRQQFGVYYDRNGEPRGYVGFETGTDRALSPDQTIDVNDWAALDPEAYRGLWEFLGAHDLVSRIRWLRAPEDDPAPFLFLDPRELHRRTADAIWMRITDVVAALPQRPYGEADALTLRVLDELCPWNDGTYVLETTGEESTVARAEGAEADVTVPAASLAILVAGSRSATQLARAGRLEARDDRVLTRADRVFATDHAPWCSDSF
jgi:predicted acetyltransferase